MVEKIVVGPLYTNCYLYFVGKKHCLIIDPGADPEVVIKQLGTLNKIPLLIVFTHGHMDHVGGATELLYHYRELNLRCAAHQEELPLFGPGAEQKHRESFRRLGVQGEALFMEMFRGVPDIDHPLKEGDMVPETDLKVLHTPGHSPGSICLYSEAKQILFSGDTLFLDGVGRTDLEGGNAALLEQSIKGKLLSLPRETRVFPGHGPHTTVERELKNNVFLR